MLRDSEEIEDSDDSEVFVDAVDIELLDTELIDDSEVSVDSVDPELPETELIDDSDDSDDSEVSD